MTGISYGASTSTGGGGRGVLEGAFALLAAVERAQGAGLTRLSSESGLPKATAHRLLEQLTALGAVERHAGGYRVGWRMFQLGQDWQPHPGLRTAAAEPARRLAELTGTAVGTAVLRRHRTLLVEWFPGSEGAALSTPTDRFPRPWYTAAGKACAATTPGHRLPPGPVPASWPREAQDIRARGFAVDRDVLAPGARCVAAPLYCGGGTPVAALFAVAGRAHRLERVAEVVRRTGGCISTRLRREND
ncbi:IclR family transcriptional regulator [Streptomyces acidiscabies]|uniref:IclR family transcriptional regulator n=1 Tax=Streptomyces acidiscabies TaxID=42234 RepID=UPI0009512B88|nr:helix-turn-helix domain-containing protein [Streptomyces acidiscabies]